jgi:phosphatidylserine/phosphatidylglycerophosphate/cardiolipin synthase-like enzyme
VTVAPPPGRRQHLRAIVQDGARLFVGSQSLRGPELDKRREIGLVVTDRTDVARAVEVFESDWSKTGVAPIRQPPVTRMPEQRSQERRQTPGARPATARP